MLTILAIGLPVGALALVYTVRRPLVMLVVMIVAEMTNVAEVLSPGNSLLPRVLLFLGLITVALALCDPVLRSRLNRGTLLGVGLVACYLVTQVLAGLGSQSVGVSTNQLRIIATDCLYLVVVLVLAQLSDAPWTLAAAVVVPLAVLSFLCLVSQVGFGGAQSFGGFASVTHPAAGLIETPRFGGPLPDCNFWGRHLVMGVPLAGALIVRAVRSGRRRAAWAWGCSLFALLAGVYLTQSRGTNISTAVALLVCIVASGPAARRRGLRTLPLLGPVLLVPGIGNRLIEMVADVSGHDSYRQVDPSILGRMAVQQIAWAMFRDRPIFGFGPATFKTEGIPQYAGSVPTAILDYTNGPDAAHNLYAQLAGESGIVGLLGWLVFVGGFVGYLAVRVVRSLAAPAAISDRTLAAATMAALVGWSMASVFLHLAYFRTFAIVLALAGALGSATGPNPVGVVAVSRRAREALLGSVFGAVVAAAIVVGTATGTHTASQRVMLLPTEQMKTNYSYSFNIRTADVLLPTCAAIIIANAPGVTAAADTVRGTITISVTAAEQNSARIALDEAMANARRQLGAFAIGSAYTFANIGSVEQSTGSRRSPRWVAVGLIAGVLLAVAFRPANRYRFCRSRQGGAHRRDDQTLVAVS